MSIQESREMSKKTCARHMGAIPSLSRGAELSNSLRKSSLLFKLKMSILYECIVHIKICYIDNYV